MFDIEPNDVLFEDFNEIYALNKDVLDDLILACEESDKVLGEKVALLGYDKALELLEFLRKCRQSYVVINLISALEAYSFEKEDEAFLDLYIAIQSGKVEDWLESCDLSKINMLSKNFREDETIALVFPDMRDYVMEREKRI